MFTRKANINNRECIFLNIWRLLVDDIRILKIIHIENFDLLVWRFDSPVRVSNINMERLNFSIKLWHTNFTIGGMNS